MHSHHYRELHRRKNLDNARSFINQHNPLQKKSPATIYRTTYKTLTPTFTNAVAGYTTLGLEDNAKKTTTTSTPRNDDENDDEEEDEDFGDEQTTLPPPITSAATSKLPTTLATQGPSDSAFTEQTSASSSLFPGATSVSSTESSQPEQPGRNAAATAGIAIGVLALVLFVFVVVWTLFRRRRNRAEQDRQNQDDEKINGPFQGRPLSVGTTRTTATAPRLSLRPVTQFLPNLEKRNSKGAAAILGGASASRAAQNTQAAHGNELASPTQSAWERPMTNQSNYADNPFGNHAERAQTPVYTPSTSPSTPVNTQFPPAMMANDSQSGPISPPMAGYTHTAPGSPDSAIVGVAGTSAVLVANGAAVASNLTRKASMRNIGPKPLDLTVAPKLPMGTIPASPAGTDFSVNSAPSGHVSTPSQSAAAIAAAGGPNNSTVHRVQLDFAPTLEDEMGLKAGQLVRLLHEYDDGWALCIRLDRSQQGVVPRTCLSARPVKPRPQQQGGAPIAGPPINPTSGGAAGRQAAEQRPQSPGSGSNGVAISHRNTPPGPSPMNPNPNLAEQVPGQAY